MRGAAGTAQGSECAPGLGRGGKASGFTRQCPEHWWDLPEGGFAEHHPAGLSGALGSPALATAILFGFFEGSCH